MNKIRLIAKARLVLFSALLTVSFATLGVTAAVSEIQEEELSLSSVIRIVACNYFGICGLEQQNGDSSDDEWTGDPD